MRLGLVVTWREQLERLWKGAGSMLRVNSACALANMAFLGSRPLAAVAAGAGAVAVIALCGAISFASWALLHGCVGLVSGWSGRNW